jgi:hypothetical protein
MRHGTGHSSLHHRTVSVAPEAGRGALFVDGVGNDGRGAVVGSQSHAGGVGFEVLFFGSVDGSGQGGESGA